MSKGNKSDTVYVVGYDPIEDRAAIGGWDWLREHAEAVLRATKHAEAMFDTHFVWIRQAQVPADLSKDQITDLIQERIIEHGVDGDWIVAMRDGENVGEFHIRDKETA